MLERKLRAKEFGRCMREKCLEVDSRLRLRRYTEAKCLEGDSGLKAQKMHKGKSLKKKIEKYLMTPRKL